MGALTTIAAAAYAALVQVFAAFEQRWRACFHAELTRGGAVFF